MRTVWGYLLKIPSPEYQDYWIRLRCLLPNSVLNDSNVARFGNCFFTTFLQSTDVLGTEEGTGGRNHLEKQYESRVLMMVTGDVGDAIYLHLDGLMNRKCSGKGEQEAFGPLRLVIRLNTVAIATLPKGFQVRQAANSPLHATFKFNLESST